MLPIRDTLQMKGQTQIESEGMEKIFHANGNLNKTTVAMLISDKVDFKTKAIIRDKERCYMIIKKLIQKEGITFVNIQAPNIRQRKYVNKILTDLMGKQQYNNSREF